MPGSMPLDPLHAMQFRAAQLVQVSGMWPASRPSRSDRECPLHTARDRCLWHVGGTPARTTISRLTVTAPARPQGEVRPGDHRPRWQALIEGERSEYYDVPRPRTRTRGVGRHPGPIWTPAGMRVTILNHARRVRGPRVGRPQSDGHPLHAATAAPGPDNASSKKSLV
jgi:hypothetical protein